MRESSKSQKFSEYLTVAEAAELLGISPWTLRNWDNAGKLKPDRHPVNGYRMYRRENLEALLRAGAPLRRMLNLATNDWCRNVEPGHYVQFYETEAYLTESVGRCLGEALSAGDGVLIIATPEHHAGIEKSLVELGLDVQGLRESGQLLSLDAGETLDKFMVGDWPDAERFRQAVGEPIARLEKVWPHVRAFGEMVMILWRQGNRDAACRLEELWNELAKQHRFSLLCAYPMTDFGEASDSGGLSQVCAHHSRVIPAESFSSLGADGQARAIAALQQQAQALDIEMAARRQLEREFVELVEHAGEGLYKVDPNGIIVWANKAELDLLGYRPDEYIGHHIGEFHADSPDLDLALARLVRGETLHNYPARLRCKDGSIRDVLINSHAMFVDGKLANSQCFTRDVTELKRARNAQALLAAIVDSSEDAIVSKTLDGVILSWNAGAERLFGYTAAEAIGQPITLIIPPELEAQEQQWLARLRRGERIEHFETVRVAKDGRRIDISLSISPVHDHNGLVIGASKVARDITDRKRAQELLRASEERLRSIFEQSTAGIAQTDLTGRFVLVNRSFCHITGRSTDELLLTTCGSITHPDDRDHDKQRFRTALRDRQAYVIEKRYVRPDGSTVWVRNSVSLIFDAAGEPQNMLAVSVDITDRKRAEEELRLSEDRYRRLMKLLPVAVYTCEAPSGVITYHNNHAAKLWGRSPQPGDTDERFCGSLRLYLPDGTLLPHHECPMAVALRDGIEVRNQEVIIERPDGSRITALVNIDAIRNAEGQIVGAINVFHDMSALKLAEVALREQKEDLQTLLETLPVAVFIAHDPECKRISGNRTAAALLRMPYQANFSKTAAPSEKPTHFQVQKNGREICGEALPIQRAARGEIVRTEEVEHAFDDGTIIHTLISAQPLFDAAGRPRGAVACMLDITELRNAVTALREADRRKDEFLATLAHELRNPLAPIRNSLNILRVTGGTGPDSERVHEMIERQVAHMVRLVDDLLELSRISRGTIELKKEPIELATVLNHAIETSHLLIESNGHRLTVSLPGEPVLLHGDSVRLSQVFANLLNNAAKYTDPGGEITVRAEREGSEVAVSVRDTGIGIPRDMLARVFDMFAQVPNTLHGVQDGLGIGLSLVQTLVTMHGGTVKAFSEGLGKGSAFVVRLPVAEPSSVCAGSDATSRRSQPSVPSTRKILVVDDNRDAADSLSMLLKLAGADVRVAYDGPAALEAIAAHRPSVAFLDLGMPGMNGYEVARQVRAKPELGGIVLIALTGWGQESNRQSSHAAGFDHHLVKPVDFAALEALLASLPLTGG